MQNFTRHFKRHHLGKNKVYEREHQDSFEVSITDTRILDLPTAIIRVLMWRIANIEQVLGRMMPQMSDSPSLSRGWLPPPPPSLNKSINCFWEVQHWVTINTSKDSDSSLTYWERKERRGQFTTTFEAIMKVTEGTRGSQPSLWEKPGLWVPPKYCCYWIWRPPELSDGESPLRRQLKAMDQLEPARAQWHACRRDDFLPSVSAPTRAQLLPALERKSNLILG
ncbi:hypothetical protein BBJ28_00018813 [Nothophytophthora sp. Chile5]|nr:hypothetical protein BBJ28_00018813 [Nothophytophthora sp. Chile5]